METENKVCGCGEAVPTEATDMKNEDVNDICRICQSPEEPNNPLSHPCACRGSLKYVHSECLFLWINRRRRKHCEICKRRYSIVPVYSDNAPERLPCQEFLKSVLLRAFRFMTLILPWLLAITFHSYCMLFLLADVENILSCFFLGLVYTVEIVIDITCIVLLRVIYEEIVRTEPELLRSVHLIANGLRHKGVTKILLVLWKYMRILCDWWHDQLLQKFPFFMRGPLGLAFVPRNTQLDEFGTIRRFLFFLDDNTFAVLAINICWSFLDYLLPYSIGQAVFVVLRCFPRGWVLENVSELTVGNIVLLSVWLAYLKSVITLTRNMFPTRTRWFSLSDVLILCFKTILLPLMLGCWIDFCTFPLTGTTLSQRLEVVSEYPLIAAKHWCVGIVYLLVALSCMKLIQEIVQKRAFWYLLDVTEPNYKITKLHLRSLLFAFAFHGAVVVIVFHLPIKTITLINRSFFPLKFGVYKDEFMLGLLAAYICCPMWLANSVKQSIKPIVQKWVIAVSSCLSLSDVLLGEPQRRDGVNHHNVRLAFAIAEGCMVSFYGSQSDTPSEEDANEQRDERFMLRVGLMLILAALSMFLVSTTIMALPVLAGRAFFHCISFYMLSFGLEHDDICAFWIGLCIIRKICKITCFVYDHMLTGRIDLLLKHVLKWIQNVLICSIWISVVPGLLGLLIDLMIIIPSQVPLDESPVYNFPHEWLVGVYVLHIWIFLTMFTPVTCLATIAWREKLQRIRSVGINHLPLTWLIRDVIGSAINTLLTTLCFPYVMVNSLFPVLGFLREANLAVQRFVWPALLAFMVIWFSAKLTRDLIVYLHQVEFDNRYKVGERLVDFTEDLCFPAENEDGGYDQALSADETEKDDDDGGDLCRICRSPEGPGDPLRYPCACRGSIKYVHQECLLLWLKRRGYKQCEVCGRSYSFVPVYSENAPERLPWNEFLRGLSLRAFRVAAYVLVILFNAFCFSLHPWGRSAASENQRLFRVSEKIALLLAGFLYDGGIVYLITMMTLLKLITEPICGRLRGIYVENEQPRVVVACVIWKYMGILCDWWHDRLTGRGFFHVLMLEPGEEVLRPRNPQLREFGAVRRFLFLLDDNAFAVLAISFYVSFFFVLLPFLMGRLVIALMLLFQPMGEILSEDPLSQEPVVIGYWIMLSLSLAYFASFATLSRAIAKILSLGFLMVAVALLYGLWLLSAKVWKNLHGVKDSFVLSLKFGLLPLTIGLWLDFCILPIIGTTVSWRLELISDCPFVMIFHWLFGQICLLWVSDSMELIQKILQKRPFWFLLDVTDPNYKITKLYLGQFLFALAFHASLIVILVHLPIMTISFISPSFFPLQLWVYEERIMFLALAAYVQLMRVRAMEWLIELIKSAIEPIAHKWINTVSSWLQLRDFFLENHANQNVRPLLQQELEVGDIWSLVLPIAEGSLVRFYGSQHDTTSEEDIDDDRFIILRIGLMLVLAAVSLFLISTLSMALPILVGRTFFHCISFILIKFGLKHDDLYGFWIGCYILRVSYVGSCFIINHIMIRRTDLLLNLVLLWIRNAILFSIWVSFIPVMLGLLIDLMIIIPSQVPLSEPPVCSLLRDWLIGLVVLHIWTYLTMFTRVKCFATAAWREKLDRIRSVGINRLPWTWLLGKVICPIIDNLLTTLAFPFWVANFLFPLLQFSGAVDQAVQRLIWPVLLAIIILVFAAKLTLGLFHYIHRLEYDDRYMVGDRVTDFVEDHE